jgi:dynein heavy chain
MPPSFGRWAHWEEKLSSAWKPPPDAPFYKILVPTVDTTRYTYLLTAFMRAERHTLITGDVGVGKTSVVFNALYSLDESFVFSNLNFSAQTSSVRVSEGIESRVEKRTKDTFAPPGGKKLIVFIDDFNMPEKEIFGAQPPLEILRQWMQYEFWYDLKKQTQRFIKDVKLLAGMGHPGGGRGRRRQGPGQGQWQLAPAHPDA